jgi:putative ABC transport system permease protein
MNPRPEPLSDRLYGALLRLFPFDFRGEFGSDMEQTFREQRLEAERRASKLGLFRLWWETISGIFHTAPREHVSILSHDIRYAVRMMRKNPGFTAVAVLTLALGIGANTAIVSVINAVLLRPLPYQNDAQLVVLHQNAERARATDIGFSAKEIEDYRHQSTSFSELAEYHSMTFTLLSKDGASRVRSGVVSPGFFGMLGVKPIIGRDLVDADNQSGAPAVLLLSYEYWKQHCGADPNIAGKTFEMNDRVHTVIGVLPPVPQYPDENDVYMPTSACPFRSSPATIGNRNARMMKLFGRLKPGVALDRSQSDLKTVASRLEQSYPDVYGKATGFTATSGLLRDELTRRARLTLLVLLGAAGCVLLIACANVANLTLARMSARERELTVRSALGAGKARLVRQLVTESFLMGLMAAAIGALFASLSLNLLVSFVARLTSRAREIQIDGSMLLFALAVAFATSIIFGSVSALCSREDLSTALKEGPPATTAGPRRKRVRGILVVCQVAFSFVLLIGAGLMLRSLGKLQQVDPGFVTQHVLAVKFEINWSKYGGNEPGALNFTNRVLSNVQSQLGVVSAAISSSYPFDPDQMHGGGWNSRFNVEGRSAPEGEVDPLSAVRTATPGYFQTLGIPLVQGRIFSDADNGQAIPVAIINQSLARHHWPNENPLGKRIRFNRSKTWIAVVGIVGDVREFGPHRMAGDELYLANAQNPVPSTLLVRTDRDVAALGKQLRRAILEADPQTAITLIETMEEARNDSLASPRVMTSLLGIFAGLALLIAAAGIGGMLALTVNQSLNEIGIRVALGAKPGQVFSMVLRQGMGLVLIGLGLGLAAALSLTRLMRTLLFEVTPTDAVTFGGVSIVLAATAILACYVPARRALRIDPLLALRRE